MAAHVVSRWSAQVDTVRAAVEGEMDAADQTATFPREALAALRRTRLLGLMVPKKYGGGGGELADLADVTASLAATDMSVGLIFAMHCQQVAAIVRYGSAELCDRVLPSIADGEVYIASVTTEPKTGGALLSSSSLSDLSDGLIRIERSAPIVTGVNHADAFLITLLAPGATSPSQVSLLYADAAQLDVKVHGSWNPLGMRSTESLPAELSGSVPENQVVGAHGDMRTIVTQQFGPMAHVGWAAAWLGAATGALSRTVAYIRGPEGRKRFDTKSELLLSRLATVRLQLDGVHALLRHSIAVMDAEPDLSPPRIQLLLNGLKVRTSEDCFTAVDELVELVGLRHGYLADSELRLERTLRDLRSASLNFSNDRLRLVNGALALLDPGVRFARP